MSAERVRAFVSVSVSVSVSAVRCLCVGVSGTNDVVFRSDEEGPEKQVKIPAAYTIDVFEARVCAWVSRPPLRRAVLHCACMRVCACVYACAPLCSACFPLITLPQPRHPVPCAFASSRVYLIVTYVSAGVQLGHHGVGERDAVRH
jgi:hypothetical protein